MGLILSIALAAGGAYAVKRITQSVNNASNTTMGAINQLDASFTKQREGVDKMLSQKIKEVDAVLTEQQIQFFKNLDVAIANMDSVIKGNITHLFDELKKYTNEDLTALLKRLHATVETLPTANRRPIIVDAIITKEFDGKNLPVLKVEFNGYSLDLNDNHIVFLGTKIPSNESSYTKLVFEKTITPKEVLNIDLENCYIEVYLHGKGVFVEPAYKNVFSVEFCFNNNEPINFSMLTNEKDSESDTSNHVTSTDNSNRFNTILKSMKEIFTK